MMFSSLETFTQRCHSERSEESCSDLSFGDRTLETHPESPPGDWVREFLKEEFSGLLN